MKRHCTTLLLGLAIAHLAAAQPTFFKQYRGDTTFLWAGLAAGSDGVSMAALSTNFDGLIVSKLDANGSEVWSKAFQDDDPDTSFFPYGDIIGTADGGFVAVLAETIFGLGLDHSVACKVSADGELLWAYRIPNVASTTGYELSANGDDVLIATTSYRNGFYLALLNAQGQPQWARRYQVEEYFDYYRCRAQFSPGGPILLSGHIDITSNANGDIGSSVRMEIDAATGAVEEALISENLFTSDIVYDGAGNRYESSFRNTGPPLEPYRYAKYGPDGQQLWCKRLNRRFSWSFLKPTPGHINLMAGNWLGAHGAYVFRLDEADGSLSRSKVYQGINAFALSENPSITSRPGGGMAWIGLAQNPTAMAIAQVDAQGEVEGCVTHSPCGISFEDAPFPEFMPIGWIEEDYPAYEPAVFQEAPFPLVDIPYCSEPWFSADFAATSPLCPGDTIQVRQEETSLEVSSEWAFEGGIPAGSTQPAEAVRYEAPGRYTIRHIAGAFGCRDTAFAEVVVQEGPVFSLGPDTAICPGGALLINSGLAPGQYELEWQDGSTAPALEAREPGAYILAAAAGTGCRRSDTLILSLYALPEVELGPDTTLCGGASLDIAPLTDAAQPLYQWSTGAVSPRLAALAEGSYALTVTDAATGCTGQDSIRISFAPPLLLRPLPDTSVCPGRPVLLEIRSQAGTFLSVQWEDGATDNPYAITIPGTYRAVASNGACDTTLNISIPAGDCRPGIYLPNAFSPNDDGRNDVFQPYGPDIELAELQVFSRWGSLLYQGQGGGARWDGSAFGKPAPAGIYAYKAVYRRLSGEAVEVVSGEVLLVR